MPVLSTKTLRAIRPWLAQRDTPADPWAPDVRKLVAEIDHALAPSEAKRKARKRRLQAKSERREEVSAVREAVMLRAGGRCENCGSTPATPLQLAHIHGGAYRRAEESVLGCVAMCWVCHKNQTNNEPSAAYWLKRFIEIAQRNGASLVVKRLEGRLGALELQGRG